MRAVIPVGYALARRRGQANDTSMMPTRKAGVTRESSMLAKADRHGTRWGDDCWKLAATIGSLFGLLGGMNDTYLAPQFDEALSDRVNERLPILLYGSSLALLLAAGAEWLSPEGHPAVAAIGLVLAGLQLILRWGVSHWNLEGETSHVAAFASIMLLQVFALAGMLLGVDASCSLWTMLCGLVAANTLLSHRWLAMTLGVLTISWLATTFSLPPARGWIRYEVALVGVWIASWRLHELRWRMAIDDLIERRPPRGMRTISAGPSLTAFSGTLYESAAPATGATSSLLSTLQSHTHSEANSPTGLNMGSTGPHSAAGALAGADSVLQRPKNAPSAKPNLRIYDET